MDLTSMTRRSLLAVAALAPRRSWSQPTPSSRAFEEWLGRTAAPLWQDRKRKVAALRSPGDVAARARWVRERFLAALGGLPETRTPLNARVTRTLDRDGYRVENLIFESLPGFHVTANVYVPVGRPAPWPALVGVAGHSSNGKASATYQHVWITLARRGVLVLALDPAGQGERSEYFHPELGRSQTGIGVSEHIMAGLQCLLTGSNIARYEVWDGIRGVDYLLSRADVDPTRIGVAGNSGGGTQAAYLAVAEPRLALAVSSCYITSWEALWPGPGPQDSEQVLAGFLSEGLDFGDFLLAFAPKPFLMTTAIQDFFPIAGARATYAEAQSVFAAAGAPDHAGYFEYDDPHGWSQPRRQACYRWIERWFKHSDDPGLEAEIVPEPEENLYATPTGQLATSLKGETVYSLNRARAEQLYRGRAALSAEESELRALVARRLSVVAPKGIPASRRDGDRIVIASEPGIEIAARWFAPASTPAPAALLLGRDHPDREALVRRGYAVLAVDARGWGASAPPRAASAYSGAYQNAMRAILIGRTLAGMFTTDAWHAFAWLAAQPGVDSARIAALGKGPGGVIALMLAALEPKVARIAAEQSISSYLQLCRSRFHENLVELIVPGVLGDFDLPDLARAIAPRSVWLIDPRTPTAASLRLAEAAAEYPHPNVHIAGRPEGWPFEKVYREFLW